MREIGQKSTNLKEKGGTDDERAHGADKGNWIASVSATKADSRLELAVVQVDESGAAVLDELGSHSGKAPNMIDHVPRYSSLHIMNLPFEPLSTYFSAS